MDAISRAIATYVVNAVWQIPVLVAFSALCVRLLRPMPSTYKHRLWVIVLIASVILPLVSIALPPRTARPPISAEEGLGSATVPPGGETHVIRWLGGHKNAALSLSSSLRWPLAGAYLLLGGFCALRIMGAYRRTLRLRTTCYSRPLPPHLHALLMRTIRELQIPPILVLACPFAKGPATFGSRVPTLLLPERFFTDISADDFSAAIAHELAHVKRSDFAWNLFYEIVSLPAALHPAVWFVKRRLQLTRELACDEIASHFATSRSAYADALLSIAQSVTQQKSALSYSLGLFDTNAMEERIMNLLNRSQPATRKMKALASLATALALTIVVVAISGFSLQVSQAASQNPELAKYVGTWTGQFQGKTFVTLTIAEEGGVLKGVCKHTTSISENDQGELTKVSDEQTTDTVLDVKVGASGAIVTIGDPGDPDHPARFDMRVTGPTTAEMRPVHHPENKIVTKWWTLTRS